MMWWNTKKLATQFQTGKAMNIANDATEARAHTNR
jgi:hypothetical protein